MGALVQQNMEALQAENIRASATNMDLASAPSLAASVESSLDFDPHIALSVRLPHLCIIAGDPEADKQVLTC